eukprot:gnl/TRDRNA2_/TRDRNA2_87310_c1_seq1.p1 gnl/TRDRNA2_/TRDRNA2_87310_c1~~gnl/TRDRNA2_/TRDRNA2_87310_c1_seq1.p1  ORF type:complete len:397 (-),score=84.15 gnl/TRDRNA2_/TRDRNA2_87310_c1_seq1:97-1287(-)
MMGGMGGMGGDGGQGNMGGGMGGQMGGMGNMGQGGAMMPMGGNMGGGGGPKMMPGVEPNETKLNAVLRVVEIRQIGMEEKNKWYTFCEMQGTTTTDPSWHDEDFLNRFIQAWESTAPPQALQSLANKAGGGGNSGNAQQDPMQKMMEMMMKVKAMMGNNQAGGGGGGMMMDGGKGKGKAPEIPREINDEDDPNSLRLRGLPFSAKTEDVVKFLGIHAQSLKYDQEKSIKFMLSQNYVPTGFCKVVLATPELAEMAKQALNRTEITCGPSNHTRYVDVFIYTEWMPQGAGFGPMGGPMGPGAGRPSPYEQDATAKDLSDKVTNIRKLGEMEKDMWYTFCEDQGTQIYDPRRHNAEFLSGFITAFEAGTIPVRDQSAKKRSGGPQGQYGGGGGKGMGW